MKEEIIKRYDPSKDKITVSDGYGNVISGKGIAVILGEEEDDNITANVINIGETSDIMECQHIMIKHLFQMVLSNISNDDDIEERLIDMLWIIYSMGISEIREILRNTNKEVN